MEPDQSADAPGELELNAEQRNRLHGATCRLLAAAARQQSLPVDQLPLGELAALLVVGVFVTLYKAGALRSCIGNFTRSIRLDKALERAAIGAACHDPRFPPVEIDELPDLTVEISLLHSRQTLGDSAAARLSSIEIGQHGLDIQHDGRSGLLLPSVAVDHGWDATTFLREVCRKAGLPPGTWKDPQATLYRFAATRWGGRFVADVAEF